MSASTVEITELKRVFRHGGRDLADPAPGQPPEKALEILALHHASLNNAVVEPPESKDGKLVYNLKTSVGTKGFTLVEIMICVVIFVLLVSMAVPACEKIRNQDRDNRALYHAWQKMEQRTDLTFEEWKKLQRAGLLRRQ